jgi:hypothetical protein
MESERTRDYDSRVVDLLSNHSNLPGEHQSQGTNVTIGWVFRAEDCLTCQNFQGELRHILGVHGSQVNFVAVHVGEKADTLLATAFFHRERLDPVLVNLAANEYRKLFGAMPLPALYVVVNSKLVHVAFGDVDSITLGEVLKNLVDIAL